MSKKIKLLYVDDEEINLRLLETHLCESYIMFLASGGDRGLELLDEHPDIKIVISDMRMPGMDGVEFIQRARDSHPQVKYFILTGFEISPRIREALKSGLIQQYFSKPVDMDQISKALCTALEEIL